MMRDIDLFLVKHGCSKPKSNAERFSYLHDLESKNPEIADLSEKLAARFAMHQVCFAERREEFAEEEINKTREIINNLPFFRTLNLNNDHAESYRSYEPLI
jgi:hypothetical protein